MKVGFLIFAISLPCILMREAPNPEITKLINNLEDPTTLFTLPKADLAMLDELNTMRSLIAEGFFNDPLKNILKIGLKVIGKVMVDIGKGLRDYGAQLVQELSGIGVRVFKFAEHIFDWGEIGVNSEKVFNGLGDLAKEGWGSVEKTTDDMTKSLTDFLKGKKRRRKRYFDTIVPDATKFIDDVIDVFKKPKNVFGPATNMNMLTYNRRLSQLAMANKKSIENDKLREITYDGKIYRVNKYGTLATYFISNTMGDFLTSLFSILRVGYLACKLWFEKIDIPNQKVADTIDKTHEMLFADRTEVGCFFTWPNTICIIGPLKDETGYLYKEGSTCSDCKYGCSNSTCNPSPEYFIKMRERYKKHLRPKIEKFEVVEGFDGRAPFLGKNFMIDSSDHSNVLIVSIVSVSLIFLIRNLF
ncbi:unnamed protein product [Caenorhabditis brenneri]